MGAGSAQPGGNNGQVRQMLPGCELLSNRLPARNDSSISLQKKNKDAMYKTVELLKTVQSVDKAMEKLEAPKYDPSGLLQKFEKLGISPVPLRKDFCAERLPGLVELLNTVGGNDSIKMSYIVQQGTARSRADLVLNQFRIRLLESCEPLSERNGRLLTLIATTGTRKKLALLHLAQHTEKRRIFVVLSFFSLIERRVQVYRKIFPQVMKNFLSSINLKLQLL